MPKTWHYEYYCTNLRNVFSVLHIDVLVCFLLFVSLVDVKVTCLMYVMYVFLLFFLSSANFKISKFWKFKKLPELSVVTDQSFSVCLYSLPQHNSGCEMCKLANCNLGNFSNLWHRSSWHDMNTVCFADIERQSGKCRI